MTSLGQTIARLSALHDQMRSVASPPEDRLATLEDFAPNPGSLAGRCYVPKDLQPGAALVVVLHGCGQDAAGYDHATGWSRLADRDGFALLFPEQRRANNPHGCFNWFRRKDTTRGSGEVASIRAMIGHMLARHGLDPQRVFVTGLSAGGAMAASLLACYPEIFAGGAIIAGLPHGVAATMPEALEAMRGSRQHDAATLQKLLATASEHGGPWPRISIWHGGADAVVAPTNAQSLLEQWQAAHRVRPAADFEHDIDGARRRAWMDASGALAIDVWDLPGMGHGTPIAADDGIGHPAPFILEHTVSSTAHIAAFFGLRPAPVAASRRCATAAAGHGVGSARRRSAQGMRSAPPSLAASIMTVLDGALPGQAPSNASVKRVIAEALRKSGLGS